mgnify:CR=1 FL=1
MANAPENIETKLKIEILLKEYGTLRTEILQRINARFAVVGLLGALFAFALSEVKGQPGMFSIYVRWLSLALGAGVLVTLWWYLGIIIQRLASHISSIEQRVNQFAGEELLTWETKYGWGRLGKLKRSR